MKILELFCGTKSISKVFEERGHQVFTVDFDKQFKPDLCKDVLDLNLKDLPKEFRNPNVIWASPPCTTFSKLGMGTYYKNGKPISYKTYIGYAIALKTVEIIKELKPKYWFIENPRGLLRNMHFMQNFHRNTITYCKYGAEYRKETDIWTNTSWIPKKKCNYGDNCHIYVPHGDRSKGVGGLKDAKTRSIIPKKLCEEIVDICEGKQKIKQNTL